MMLNEFVHNGYYTKKGWNKDKAFRAQLDEVEEFINDNLELDLNPIPLTEEWLLKFGFVRDLALEKLDSRREFMEYKYGNQNEHQFIRVCSHDIGGFTLSLHGTPLTKPKFVHKLQNTVYELIDKELTIKE